MSEQWIKELSDTTPFSLETLTVYAERVKGIMRDEFGREGGELLQTLVTVGVERALAGDTRLGHFDAMRRFLQPEGGEGG